MSESVWFEEVNRGLLEEIYNTVRIKNAKDELVPLPRKEKCLIVRKPEEDLKFEVFPCVSIYAKSYHHDSFRYNNELTGVVLARDPESHVLTGEEQAVPFNLDYQIDFWAKYQTDMDTMTRTWLMKHFRQFNLDVVDDGGTPRSVNVLSQGSIVKSDLVLGKERLFHSIISYTIWVEIDDNIGYTKPMVTTIDIDAHDKLRGKI